MTNTKQIPTGFFDMADCNAVVQQATLQGAKQLCLDKVEKFTVEYPSAHNANVNKAVRMIMNAKSQKQLAFGIANFILAHPSENLKSI